MAKASKKATAPEAVVEAPVVVEVPVAETAPTTSVEPVQLTIADLQLLARIVGLASRRGAFQAPELSQVGDAYNKLSGFLAYVESTQAAEAATTPAEAPVEAPAA